MRTLLVLAQHPELADAVRGALNPEHYRVVHRGDYQEAEPILNYGLVDACLIDVELSSVQGVWPIEKLRRRLPDCPIIVYTGAKQGEWEEEAYLQGVAHVLTKPVRNRLLNSILERLWPAPRHSPSAPARPSPPRPLSQETVRPAVGSFRASQTLQVLRDFSAILSHSLCAEALLKQFLLLLREILGVNRAAIFLRPHQPTFVSTPTVLEARRLRSACAIGLAPGLLEHFELSLEAGIGGFLFREGRILRCDGAEVQGDTETQKEFELLGAQVAIPILDRESLIGVAVFDGRVTGEPLANEELELIFHLLEEMALAVRNIWLHDQLVANHEMMADILRHLSSACVVVSRDLTVLHANKAARHLFAPGGRRGTDLEFSDLPQLLGSRVYQVLKTGTGVAPFKYSPPDSPELVFQVSLVPFQPRDTTIPDSALLVVEDCTQAEQLRHLELETANLRLLRTMAERLSHEIGNALVPLSTHQQLLAEKYRDPAFRASLDVALGEGVKRITRLINQVRFLARDAVTNKEAIPLVSLVEEAFHEAQKHQVAKSARLQYEHENQPIIVAGDRAALKQALAEIMINALQANPADARIKVSMEPDPDGNGISRVLIDIQDNGSGFSPESAEKASEPFYTTRSVGLGLGLTVSRKIVETHQGKLSILGSPGGHAGVVRVSLPLDQPSAKSR
jgi:signal transduction histidine kinase/ActR/RegA family two-component response regulator